jgi:hypothetical protein
LKNWSIVWALSVTEWLVSNVIMRILIHTQKFRTANKTLPPLCIFVSQNLAHPFAEPSLRNTDLIHLNIKILNIVKILKELLFDASSHYVLVETLCYFEVQCTFIVLYIYLTWSTQKLLQREAMCVHSCLNSDIMKQTSVKFSIHDIQQTLLRQI